MKNESKVANPTQVRIQHELKDGIERTAKKYMRSKQADIIYRLKLVDEMERNGEIVI